MFSWWRLQREVVGKWLRPILGIPIFYLLYPLSLLFARHTKELPVGIVPMKSAFYFIIVVMMCFSCILASDHHCAFCSFSSQCYLYMSFTALLNIWGGCYWTYIIFFILFLFMSLYFFSVIWNCSVRMRFRASTTFFFFFFFFFFRGGGGWGGGWGVQFEFNCPVNPSKVMSSVSLPNHTFSGQAVIYGLTSTCAHVFAETDNRHS